MFIQLIQDLLKHSSQSIKNSVNSLIFSETTKSLAPILGVLKFFLEKKDSIIICNSLEEANYTFNIANNIFKLNNVFLFPDFGLDPYSKASSPYYISYARINTLYGLINNNSVARLVITTPLGFIHKTIAKEGLINKNFILKVNNNIKLPEVINFLINLGYTKVETVTSPKTFALRGDILDIYLNDENPYRLSIFDNIIESIKTFNSESQRTEKSISELVLTLPSEIILNDQVIEHFKYEYQVRFGSFAKNDMNLEALNNNMLPSGFEHYLPIFVDKSSYIHDYLSENFLLISLLNIEDQIKQIWHNYRDAFLVRNNNKAIKSEHVYYVLPPEELLLDQDKAISLFYKQNNVTITGNSLPEGISTTNGKEVEIVTSKSKDACFLFNLKSSSVEKCKLLAEYISKDNNGTVVLNFLTPEIIDLLKEALHNQNIKYVIKNNLNDIEINKVNITNNNDLLNGFIVPNLTVIAENDLVALNKVSSNINKRKKAKNAFKNTNNISVGELVVHVKHGVGKFIGLTTLDLGSANHDFLLIEYKNNDKLYLPVENIDLIGRFGGSEAEIELDKLGSGSWEKKQAKVREKIKDIAYDLIKLAASRNVNQAPIIEVKSNNYTDFSTKFPYIETDDQQAAILDIEQDFLQQKIMDRLVCGDVGFGKTEVAMRAVFLAANSGYQVAVIAPTTLLCRQHYYNFIERFKGFNFNIKQLSKFVTAKEKKEIKEELKIGNVNIVIGTHALLAKDIHFSNLGLLVIDEEQNFGVLHKEKLKTLKDNVHVLTLTATPIPRTLQMALTKVKDLSIIATPPINKLSIQTYVMPNDMLIIKEGIEREIKRNGQIFYVTPYIKDITLLEVSLKELDSNWRTLVIHGGLTAEQIEKGMEDFQQHKYDILLSTNIIESGIDLRNVNTIIINNADKFGLSQLYQLRGRVGRGENQAFAYITYKSQGLLTENAEKRLLAIQNLDYLGAGFALAEHDLDIRGAGNILGEEQSGHIKEIGFDLYQKFLAQEIEKAKHKDGEQITFDSLSPNIKLDIPSLIPSYYIPDIVVRMDFYSRLGTANTLLEVEDISDELIDRFGKIPAETLNLMTTIKLKIICKALGIEKLYCGSKSVTINFYNNKVDKFDNLMNYIFKSNGIVKLKPDSSIVVSLTEEDKQQQIKQLFIILNELKIILFSISNQEMLLSNS
ncbi:transcription-repair coupling factor [Rickettsiales bacterium LUAb2]